jgi:hypothetical protein
MAVLVLEAALAGAAMVAVVAIAVMVPAAAAAALVVRVALVPIIWAAAAAVPVAMPLDISEALLALLWLRLPTHY